MGYTGNGGRSLCGSLTHLGRGGGLRVPVKEEAPIGGSDVDSAMYR
jgi:hypothetical protein